MSEKEIIDIIVSIYKEETSVFAITAKIEKLLIDEKKIVKDGFKGVLR